MSTPFVIETHELSKTYKNVHALQSLNLKVQQNSIFGFLGPNGAGKTTTIKLMLGLIRPTAGKASIFGMDTIRKSVDIRARVGYLPQEPHFYEYMTARQTLRLVTSLDQFGRCAGESPVPRDMAVALQPRGILLQEQGCFDDQTRGD